MLTKFSNNITIINPSQEVYFYAKDNLVVTNPKWAELKRIGKNPALYHVPEKMSLYTENGFDLVLPFGVYKAIWPLVLKGECNSSFNQVMDIECKNDKSTLPLFGYQQEAVEKMLVAKGGVISGACGCGKTNMLIEIIKRVGLNALWLCHTGDLLRQTVERIKKLYPNMEIGTITDGKIHMANRGITVATVQTISKIDKDIYKNNFGTVVVDECHKVSGSPTLLKMFAKVVNAIPARFKYGVSATLTRSDTLTKTIYTTLGLNSSGEFGPEVVIDKSQTNTLTAIHERVDLDTPFDYSCLKADGTFDYVGLIDFLSQNEERNDTIVANIVKSLEVHKKQIVFCQRVEQCENINNKLHDLGVNSVLLVGKVSDKKRKEILGREIDWNVIVTTYSLGKEGLDCPELSCLHFAMLTAEKVATVQCAGRIERVYEGKPDPVIYDYVDTNYPYCIGKFKKRQGYLRRR